VQSSRALGVFALSAVILAAVSFAVVDVFIADAGPDAALPLPALIYAVIGAIALLVSVAPAFAWLVKVIEHPHHDADLEPMPVPASTLASYTEEDL
jgi:hypothetical protein